MRGISLKAWALFATAALASGCIVQNVGTAAVAIAPKSATVEVGATQKFRATVSGVADTAVTWSVQETGGGSIDSSGSYRAPSTAGTYHVVARSAADAGAFDTATVTVVPFAAQVAVEVIPQEASVLVSRTLQLTAQVTGTSNTAVTWSVRETGGGSISASGLYTAPATAGAYHAVATSAADSTRSQEALIHVTQQPLVVVSVSPHTARCERGKTVQLTATVTGSTNTAVTWAVQEAGGGSIDASGRYSAPQATGTFHAIATSAADATKSDTAAVEVTCAQETVAQFCARLAAAGKVCGSIADHDCGGAPRTESCGTAACATGECDATSNACVSQCGEGAVPSAGCVCGGARHTSGFCCGGAWRADLCSSGGIIISAALALSSSTVHSGERLTGSVTYQNTSASAVSLQDIVIGGRRPGAAHLGGPYDDFTPNRGPVTLQPGATVTVTAHRDFTDADPEGTWISFATYQDAAGDWHDGPDVSFQVAGSAACAEGAVPAAGCTCGGAKVASGFCCGGQWQALDCAACTRAAEICGDGVDQDCSGADLACPACSDGPASAVRCTCAGSLLTSGYCCGNAPSATACAQGHDLVAWLANLPDLSNGKKWNPGIPGGIPAGTLDTTLTAAQMTANGINAAIQAASARGSPTNVRVVQMPAGTFSISGEIVPRNHVILRGAGAWGSGRTRLNFNGGGVMTEWPDWPSANDMVLPAGGSLPVGSTAVTVSSAADFAVGDIIQLDQLDDLSYVALLDAGYHKRAPFPDGPYSGPLSPGGFRSVTSLHEVTAVHGTTLTFDPPTRIAFTYFSAADGATRLRPEVWRVSRHGTDGLWWFGLESVSIAGPDNAAVAFRKGAYSWIKDVETDGSANGGISGDHVAFEHMFRSEIRRMYAHHTAGGPYSGGANYGINLNAATSECLVIDSIVLFMNKLIQTNACGPGNVIAYNYVDNTSANGGDWMDGAINGSHQSFSHHLLVEGNWSANIGCDTTHGNSGYMAFLRNYAHGRSTVYDNGANRRAANSDGWQREMAFLGNVLATGPGGVYEVTGTTSGQYAIWSVGQFVWGSGDDYDAQTTRPPANDMNYGGVVYDRRQATFTTKAKDKLWRHGNWDSVNASIHDWDPAFPAHGIPQSLFLTSAPAFFSGNVWPWIDPTAATAAERMRTLPAKARYDAGTPFAP